MQRWDDGLAHCDSDRFEGMHLDRFEGRLVPVISEMHLQKRHTKEPCFENQKLKCLFCTSDFGKILKEVEHY